MVGGEDRLEIIPAGQSSEKKGGNRGEGRKIQGGRKGISFLESFKGGGPEMVGREP